jgi:ubiquinone/menaquinone biosynthesis C-methylase UbiE
MEPGMKEDAKNHFDTIADGYHEEISGHVRDHLINKWWGIVSSHFMSNPRVLDIGCGEGTNVNFMSRKNINAQGVDFSDGLVKQAHARYPQLASQISQGDALHLQFEDASFDVATLIGVLHHIYSREDQILAIQEALRVVRKGGVVIIRESNLINPVFRLFWNYIFPLTAKIDRFGGEHWIPASYLRKHFPRQIEDTVYFTFIPNFMPQSLMGIAEKIERRLEAGPLHKLSAHYTAILRKA